jgi:hypothetical protein
MSHSPSQKSNCLYGGAEHAALEAAEAVPEVEGEAVGEGVGFAFRTGAAAIEPANPARKRIPKAR